MNQNAKHRIESTPALIIAGVCKRYLGDKAHNIPAQWAEFAAHLDTFEGRIDAATYGVVQGNANQPEAFDYWSGVAVANAHDAGAFPHIELPSATYAKFPSDQHVSQIQPFCAELFSKVLPELQLTPCDAPFIEHYTAQFEPATGVGFWEIWIPVQPTITAKEPLD